MKVSFRFIGLLLILALVSCDGYRGERRHMEQILADADSLFGVVSIDDQDFSKIMDQGVPMIDLENASKFFANMKEYSKASKAALYGGYVQLYFGESSNAMHSFKDAERFGELSDECLVVAKARARMGRLLFEDYMEEEALVLFKQAEKGFEGQYEECAMLQNMIAVTHIVLKEYDSAEFCLRQGRIYADLAHSDKAKLKTIYNSSILHRMQGDYGHALDCLRQIEVCEDSTFLFLSNLNRAKIFAAMSEKDSASLYFQRTDALLNVTTLSYENKLSAYLAFACYYEGQNDLSKALESHKRYESLLDEFLKKKEEKAVFGIQRKYGFEALQNVMNRRMLQKHRIILIISFVCIIGLGMIAYMQYRLSKSRKEEEEIRFWLVRFAQQNRVLAERGETKDQLLNEYADRLSDLLKKEALTMRKMDIYMRNKGDFAYLKALEKAVFSNEDHWEAMMSVFDSLYPGVRENLVSYCPELTEMEQKVFILSYFNVSREDEALMFQKSVHSVDKWRASVSKKTKGKVFTL